MPTPLSWAGGSFKRSADIAVAIQALVWAALAIGGIGSTLIVLLYRHHQIEAAVIGISAASFGICIGIIARLIWEAQRGGMLGYRIKSLTYEYSFDSADPRQQSQTVEVEILALRDGVGVYFGRYGWSGSGNDPGPRIVDGDAMILTTPPYASAGWRRIFIVLNRPLSKGKVIKFKYQHTLFDERGKFSPFLAKTLEEHTDLLALKVVFPDTFMPKSRIIGCCRSASPASDKIYSESDLGLNSANRSVEMVLRNPKRRLKYAIEWNWPEYIEHCNQLGLPR